MFHRLQFFTVIDLCSACLAFHEVKTKDSCLNSHTKVKNTTVYKDAGTSEHSVWQQRGATKDKKGLLRFHKGLVVAPMALLTLLLNEFHSVGTVREER